MDLNNKKELEKYFADHFDTVLFPVLADIYKTEGDIIRAKKVCEIGLEYHPNNVDGLFILAELNYMQNDLLTSERLLKNVLSIEPLHYRALLNLAKIQLKLNRTSETIGALWRKIVKINPTHPEAKNYLAKQKSNKDEVSKVKKAVTVEKPSTPIDKSNPKIESKTIKKETPVDTSPVKASEEKIIGPNPPTIKPQKVSEEDLQSLDISKRMATFTMVNVLKKQKLYQQALSVLSMLEEKGADQALINQERETLQKLIKENEAK